jgi:endogenous inhibitor of DNA gyrase (YacG/DUF329 family)
VNVIGNCEWCGKQTEKHPAQVLAHNFCSKRCFGLWRRGRKLHSDATKERLRRLNLGKKNPQLAEMSRGRRGERHPRWVGENSTNPKETGRHRAQANFPAGPCEHCGASPDQKRIERHHKDLNTLNNNSENVVLLCRKCHCDAHADIKKRRVA